MAFQKNLAAAAQVYSVQQSDFLKKYEVSWESTVTQKGNI